MLWNYRNGESNRKLKAENNYLTENISSILKYIQKI